MDKNTVIGLSLILAILVGFSIFNKPSQEQLDAQRAREIQDSIAMVQQLEKAAAVEEKIQEDSIVSTANEDSLKKVHYGLFANFTQGEITTDSIENDKLVLTFTSKGGRLASVRLKEFADKDSMPLVLFNEKESQFNVSFFSAENRLINTSDLIFNRIKTNDSNQIIYRISTTESTYLDFIYTIKPDDYLVDFKVKGTGLDQVLPPNTNSLDFSWSVKMKQQEKGRSFEERYSQMDYKFPGGDVENLSASKEDDERIDMKIHWVSFKDQFFTSIALSKDGFSSNELSSNPEPEESGYLKTYAQKSALPFDLKGKQEAEISFFFGPIKYALLKNYNKELSSEYKPDFQKIVPLGGSLFRWVNTGIILPLFNFFGKFISNYGIIILLLTLVIKILIFPFTWKSNKSSAQMRVLQPQIQEINAKYVGNEKAAERSQATMELYKRVGVSPMGGCLPILLQMPVLFAMFSFFPSSIELRHESFLWADDLSTYDVLVQWSGNIPLVTKYFGNHVSLFCLLMTITNLLYTHLNMKNQPTSSAMPGMKTMSYLMPVMFLFIFNQYSAGLSLYFFVSTLISILQTYAFRWFTNEEKLLAQMNENKKKPIKKSGFQARLEQAQKEQQRMLKEKQKNRK
jgi:YidC/Oxa1 family membrane protein insertase